MGGDEIRINEYGYLMLHNPSTAFAGGSKGMRETADLSRPLRPSAYTRSSTFRVLTPST